MPTGPCTTRRPAARSPGRWRRRGAWVAAGLGAALAGSVGWTGCSVDRHYRTLSFFFDGVPNPEAKAAAQGASGVTAAMRASATYTVHRPFAEERCGECHRGQLEFRGLDSRVCLKCHEGEKTRHARMHGPVAAGECLWCHLPHESAEAHLLRKAARQTCVQCHDASLLKDDGVPAHADAARGCLECHSGHGGSAPMFLKEGVSRLAPDGPAGRGAP